MKGSDPGNPLRADVLKSIENSESDAGLFVYVA